LIRVLIADDHAIIAACVAALLRGTDYEMVRHVRDGALALAAIDEEKPDIVILDERLPGMTGLDIFRALRAKGDKRPVVLQHQAIDARLDRLDVRAHKRSSAHTRPAKCRSRARPPKRHEHQRPSEHNPPIVPDQAAFLNLGLSPQGPPRRKGFPGPICNASSILGR